MPKPSFKKKTSDAIQPIAGRIRGIHTFPKGICPKMNVLARLEFELACYDSATQSFNNYFNHYPSIPHHVKIFGHLISQIYFYVYQIYVTQ